jgi:uncharacterized protein YigE (DUF2233 family)
VVQTPPPLITPSPQATIPPDSGWQAIQSGLELRTILLFGEDGRQTEELSIVRLEPDLFEFKVAYHPGEPQTLRDWQAETGALLVVNGGFFTETFYATGLTVIDGQHSGASYGDFAGMFAITAVGPKVRWLAERPYDLNEPLHYALQAFPMLVKPGAIVGYPEEDGSRARRTAVAQDVDGRILFIIAPWGSLTLHEFSVWLAASDLNLETALNLDGGTSSGLFLAEPEHIVPAFTRLPIVITASAK